MSHFKDRVHRLKFMREAADVQRLHVIRTVGEYSNGQHTFNMLSILRLIWPEAPRELIWAILEHDLTERLVGDIPSPSINFGGFVDKGRLEELEHSILSDLFVDGQNFIGLDDELKGWLKGLDLFELYLYCRDQVMMGNQNLSGMAGRIERRFVNDAAKYPKHILDLFYEVKNNPWYFTADLA